MVAHCPSGNPLSVLGSARPFRNWQELKTLLCGLLVAGLATSQTPALRSNPPKIDGETANGKSSANGATGASSAQTPNPPTAKELGGARFALIKEAQRVAALRKMKVAEVVDRAAKGAFTYERIKQLPAEDIPAMKAATEVLRKVKS